MADYFFIDTMAVSPAANTPPGTLGGVAAYVAGSPSYVRLTTATNSVQGSVNRSFALPSKFDITADILANGGADATYFYWGCSSIPSSEDAGVGYGGYIVAFDEYNDQTQLWFNGTQLAAVGFSGSYGDNIRRIVTVEVRDQNIKVYADGVLQIDYTDIVRTLPGTSVGYAARTGGVNAEHRVYSFGISSVVETPTTTPNVVTPYSGIQNLDSKYTLEIYSNTGSLIGEFSGRAQGRQVRLIRNGVYEATWKIDVDTLEDLARQINTNAKSILGVGTNEVQIKRLGVSIFGGKIISYDGSISEKREVTIKCVGWFELLKDRFTMVEKVFSATDAGTIAKTLIDDTQALTDGSLGIITSSGQIQASVNRDRTYPIYKNVKDAITQLAEVQNGFDFEFAPDKKFYVYYPAMGGTRTDFAFEYPGNIKTMRISTNAKELINEVIVRGNGQGEATITRVVSDAASKTAYKLRQQIVEYADISESATLDAHGNEIISAKKSPIEIISLTVDGDQNPKIGNYWLGDRVRVRMKELTLYQHIDADYRVDEIVIKIDENDAEEVDLKLTL